MISAQSNAIAKSYFSTSLDFFNLSILGKNENDFEYSGIIISTFFPISSKAKPVAKELPTASPSGNSCVSITIFSAFFISSNIVSSVIFLPFCPIGTGSF